jgi:hypothetical protein
VKAITREPWGEPPPTLAYIGRGQALHLTRHNSRDRLHDPSTSQDTMVASAHTRRFQSQYNQSACTMSQGQQSNSGALGGKRKGASMAAKEAFVPQNRKIDSFLGHGPQH